MPNTIDQVLQDSRSPGSSLNGTSHTNTHLSSINRTPPLSQESSRSEPSRKPSSRSTRSRHEHASSRSHADILEDDEASASEGSAKSKNGSDRSGGSSSNVTDFFSPEVFQLVIHNPTTAYRLLRYCQIRNCGETMEFLQKVCSAFICEFMGEMVLETHSGPNHEPG